MSEAGRTKLREKNIDSIPTPIASSPPSHAIEERRRTLFAKGRLSG